MTWLALGVKYDSEEEANAVAYEHRQPWYLDVPTGERIAPVRPEHFGRRSSIKKRVLIGYFKNGTTFRDQVLAAAPGSRQPVVRALDPSAGPDDRLWECPGLSSEPHVRPSRAAVPLVARREARLCFFLRHLEPTPLRHCCCSGGR